MSAFEAEVLAWLSDRAERRIDTACARVFLAGETAWKVKRPVVDARAATKTPLAAWLARPPHCGTQAS